jgi:hypothetical protein
MGAEPALERLRLIFIIDGRGGKYVHSMQTSIVDDEESELRACFRGR